MRILNINVCARSCIYMFMIVYIFTYWDHLKTILEKGRDKIRHSIELSVFLEKFVNVIIQS